MAIYPETEKSKSSFPGPRLDDSPQQKKVCEMYIFPKMHCNPNQLATTSEK
jgi:hypothetical protein